mgnify:FL=1
MNDEPEIPLLVEDVMSSPVVTVREDDTVEKVAKLMDEYSIGSVVVVRDKDEPVGVITERDIVRKVVAKDRKPSEVRAAEIMSTPLFTIEPDKDVKEAARTMGRYDIRRLIVMHKGRMVGIVSSRDILQAVPSLLDLMIEKCRAGLVSPPEEEVEAVPMAGYCELCGRWSDTLIEVNGQFICEECRAELEREE